MNENAKRLLGSCSGVYTPRTPEELEEARLIRHRAELRADRAYQIYEEGQAVALQKIYSEGKRFN